MNLSGVELDEIWPGVVETLDAELDKQPRFINRAVFLRDIERQSLHRMMRRFLRGELERASTRQTHPAFFEWGFGMGNRPPLVLGGAVPVTGIIDRVDLVDGSRRDGVVIDYKTTTHMSLKDLAEGRVLQAPVYALALDRVFHIRPLGAEFMGIKRDAHIGVYQQQVEQLYAGKRGMRLLDETEWQALLEDAEERIVDAVHDMQAGHIDLEPTTSRCPENCAYFSLCRGNRFDLARRVRENRKREAETV